MMKLNSGEFYGEHYQTLALENITITDTEYTHPKVDWHYHQNPYFTYLLQGKLFEANKKSAYYLEPGDLLFHNWQDAHYNIKPPEYTRGFHIELNDQWFSDNDINIKDVEGSIHIAHPYIKSLMNQVFIESKIKDNYTNLTIESLIVDIYGSLKESNDRLLKKPQWVQVLQELIVEEDTEYSLKSLSAKLDIHPVHLSRSFRRYFGTTLGNYMRLLKLNRAFHLLAAKKFTLTEIAYQCGYYDQSHFISNFKAVYKTTPTEVQRQVT